MGSPSLFAHWRRTAALGVAAAIGVATLGAAMTASAGAPGLDIAGAKAGLASFVATNPPLPASAPPPTTGPRCPLADNGQFGYAQIDGELQSDTGQTVAVVHCRSQFSGAYFAFDASPFGSGLPIDRVARRFGVGQTVWVHPAGLEGVMTGRYLVAGRLTSCIALVDLRRPGDRIHVDRAVERGHSEHVRGVSATASARSCTPWPSACRRRPPARRPTHDDLDHARPRRRRPRPRRRPRRTTDDHVDHDDAADHDDDHDRPRRRRRPRRRPRRRAADDDDDHDHDDGAADHDDHDDDVPPTTTTTDHDDGAADDAPRPRRPRRCRRRRPRPRRRRRAADHDHDDDGAADDARRPRRDATTTTTTVPPTTTTRRPPTTTEPPTTRAADDRAADHDAADDGAADDRRRRRPRPRRSRRRPRRRSRRSRHGS